MTLRCEDLPDFGLVLVPSSSPDDRPVSATLNNNSNRILTALSLLWRYQDVNARTWTGGRTSYPGILPGHQYQCTESGWRSATGLESLTLVIDGAFFADGEFVGPGTHGLWETVTSEFGIRREAALAARSGLGRGVPASDIL